MEILENKLKSVYEKYRKEYASVCEPINGLESRRDNALKFDPINEKFIDEITEELNKHLENNSEYSKEQIIEIGQKYIKGFQKYLFDPFC